jgi:hypothetical protein
MSERHLANKAIDAAILVKPSRDGPLAPRPDERR